MTAQHNKRSQSQTSQPTTVGTLTPDTNLLYTMSNNPSLPPRPCESTSNTAARSSVTTLLSTLTNLRPEPLTSEQLAQRGNRSSQRLLDRSNPPRRSQSIGSDDSAQRSERCRLLAAILEEALSIGAELRDDMDIDSPDEL